jgi:UDP-N-acetylmuramoyl-tripeptide--D-alanyl-D-alanine ligase
MAAAAVGLHLGLELADVVMGLECATGSPMRMETYMTAGGVHVVNDAYNASPASMRAALAALCDMVADERRVAILGDMAELGSLTELAHFELGERIADMDLDQLIAIGPRARRIAEGARAAGMERDRALAVETREEGIEIARERIGRGDVVLVKASRVMGLEAVVEAIS